MTQTPASVWTPPATQLRQALAGLSTIAVLLSVIVVVLALNLLVDSVLLDRFITEMFIDITMVVGLQIFMGNTNILWFPHVGFMGIGAYASVIFTMGPVQKLMSLPEIYPFLAEIEMAFLPALLCGALVAAVAAAIIGLPMMRLSDFPAVIAGFALLVVIHVVLLHWTALTNGPQTLFGVERHTYSWTAALWAALAIIAAYLFKESKVGLQLRASREDLIAARTVGINIMFVRWLGLVLSAFIAGLSGGLYAHYITAFMPNAFFLTETFVILSMLVIGGPATISGAVAGGVLVTIFYQSLRWVENSEAIRIVFPGGAGGASTIALALILIAILVWRPGGLFEREELSYPALARASRRLRGALTGAGAERQTGRHGDE
jgi:branched-chain amino acid transport system permease protein